MNATTLTIHNTGNPTSTVQNERDWLTNPENTRTASFHIGVGENEVVECLPLNENAWHSGDGNSLTSGNRSSIGIEICESGNYAKTLNNAVELVAKMLKERGWGIDKLRRHWDWARPSDGYRKICPRLMYDDGKWTGWIEFKKRVNDILNPKIEPVKLIVPTPTKTLPQIVKERVYLENGVLKRCDGNYKIVATDVRHIKFETGKVKYKFVYEKGAKVSSLVKKYGADFGFNAPFFDIKTGTISGDAWDGEKVVSKSYGKTLKWHGLSVRGGKPRIGKFSLDDPQDLLVLGAPPLVENGQLVYEKYRVEHEVNDDIGKRKCQRTFVWIDSNGDLHLGIADGRVPDSDVGLSLEEMALYAKSHGAVNSITFDGGGSTILADQTGGLNQKLNNGINERVVNHAILVFVEKDIEIKNEITDKEFDDMDKIKVDLKDGDKKLVADAFLSNGKTYIELRTISEYFGAQVGWDQTNKRASVQK